MKPRLTLENFGEVGTGWYLKLDGFSIAVILPSDLEAICYSLSAGEDAIQRIREAQPKFYPELVSAR